MVRIISQTSLNMFYLTILDICISINILEVLAGERKMAIGRHPFPFFLLEINLLFIYFLFTAIVGLLNKCTAVLYKFYYLLLSVHMMQQYAV